MLAEPAGRFVFITTWLPVGDTLASAVIVIVPRPKVNLLGSGTSVIESAEIAGLPMLIVSEFLITLIFTYTAVCAVANGNAEIASNPKLIKNP